MSIRYVGQVASYYNAAGPQVNNITPAVNVDVGTFLVLSGRGGGGYTVTSVSDTGSNTWTLLTTSGASGNTATIWYCYVTTALTTSSTITVTYTTSNIGYSVAIYAFTGINRPVTTSAVAQGTAVTTLSAGNITPSQYGSLLFTTLTHSGPATSINVPTGFTSLANATRVEAGYIVAGSMSSVATSWSWTTSANASVIGATFTPDGGDFLALF